MNENTTVKELLAQLKNCAHIVREINAAYLGCKPDDVRVTQKDTNTN